MRALRLGTIATAALVLVLAAALPAYSDPWGEVNCDLDPDRPECRVVVIDPAGDTLVDGGADGVPVCRIDGQIVACHEPGLGWLHSDGCYHSLDERVGPGEHWWARWCYDPANDAFFSGGWVWRLTPPASAQHVVQRAVDRLGLPVPAMAANPALDTQQVVHVPVWWWIQPGWWSTRTATASIPALSITAEATPTQVTWHAGDGSSTTCTGPGTPWTTERDPAEASPTCGHTYTTTSRTSPGGVYNLRVVVTWQVTWAGPGMSGTVPAITTTATTQVTVTELRSVVTG